MKLNTKGELSLTKHWIDYDEEKGLRFLISGLSGADWPSLRVALSLTKHVNPETEEVVMMHRVNDTAMRMAFNGGLHDWEGVVDSETGEAVPFSLDRGLIDQFNSDLLYYLFWSIFDQSILDDDAKKKSLYASASLGKPKSTTVKHAKRGTVRKKRQRRSPSTK